MWDLITQLFRIRFLVSESIVGQLKTEASPHNFTENRGRAN